MSDESENLKAESGNTEQGGAELRRPKEEERLRNVASNLNFAGGLCIAAAVLDIFICVVAYINSQNRAETDPQSNFSFFWFQVIASSLLFWAMMFFLFAQLMHIRAALERRKEDGR
jgi:hypothetical protein